MVSYVLDFGKITNCLLILQGEIYNSCTNKSDPDGFLWCATKVPISLLASSSRINPMLGMFLLSLSSDKLYQ